MTGRPAELKRRFRFISPPAWVHLLLLSLGTELCLFGAIAYVILVNFLGPNASGYLPLTRASGTRLTAYLWITISLVPLSIALIAAGLVVGNTLEPMRSEVGLYILLAGLVLAVASVIAVIVRPYLGPGARVYNPKPGESDKVVELKRVHRDFVAAVRQMNEAPVSQLLGPT